MTTINFTAISEPITIVLSNQDATYGIKRSDNQVLVAPPATAVTKISALEYSYTFTDPAYDLEYDYCFKIEYDAGIFTYVPNIIDGPELVTSGKSWVNRLDADAYFGERLFIRPWENALDTEKDKALIMATSLISRLSIISFTVTPQDLKNAVCELALALLDGRNPEMEFENLSLLTSQYSSVRSTYDRSIPQEHIQAGIPSYLAWKLIRPYLDVSQGVILSRAS
jgi:hypothetical protein